MTRRALFSPRVLLGLIGTELLAKVPWSQIETAAPFPGPFTVNGTGDGIELSPVSSPPPPVVSVDPNIASRILLFFDAANSNKLSSMDSTGKVTAIQP